jgi:hypothetical protein
MSSSSSIAHYLDKIKALPPAIHDHLIDRCDDGDCAHADEHEAFGQKFGKISVDGVKNVHAWKSKIPSAAFSYLSMLHEKTVRVRHRADGKDTMWTHLGSDGRMHGNSLCYDDGRHCTRFGSDHPELRDAQYNAHEVARILARTATIREVFAKEKIAALKGKASSIVRSMSEAEVKALVKHSTVACCTDMALRGTPSHTSDHPQRRELQAMFDATVHERGCESARQGVR